MLRGTPEVGTENEMPPCIQASSLRVGQFISFSSQTLDTLMQGGIRCGVVTEFVGESNSGKTQLSLQLALTVQLPLRLGGLYGMVVYFCCDYAFPMRRLKAVEEAINKKVLSTEEKVSLDNVLVQKVENCQDMRYQLKELEKLCLQRAETPRHVRLVLIDSFASIFRSQFENNKADMTLRSKYYTCFSTKLREITHTYNVAVVVTNQVAVDFSGTTYTTNNHSLVLVDGHQIVPALGLSWANCVHNRVFLKISQSTNTSAASRKMQIIFSPYMPEAECEFVITSNGVE